MYIYIHVHIYIYIGLIRQHCNMLGEEDTVTSYLVNGTFADGV